jgi:hypothetical protein
MKQNRSFAVLAFFVILGVGAAFAYARYRIGANVEAGGVGVCAFVLALVVASAIQIADQWDRAVILRLGKFRSLKGPGLFFIVPVLDPMDRHPRHYDRFQSGKDADQGYGASGCGCRTVLESGGPKEGGFGRGGLSKRH